MKSQMRRALHALVFVVTTHCTSAFAETSSLQNELDSVAKDLPAKAEPMYVVQDRQSGLGGVFEIGATGGKQFNTNIFVDIAETSAFLAYHLTNRFFVHVEGTQASNHLTASGKKLWNEDGVFPNVAFVKRKVDGVLGFNLLYGKLRISRENIAYFDQYIALGGGMVEQTNGEEISRAPSAVADVGVAFWYGRYLSVRLGGKDTYYEERRILDSSHVHRMVGYAGVSVLLGGAG